MTPESAPTLETLDKERVLHPATSIADHLKTGPRIMTEGSGITLTDTAGRRYLDAVAGLWCVNIGYGRTEVADAMGAQARRLAYYHTFSSMSNEPQIRLADRLLRLTPGPMSKVFFGNSGSDANDTQVKLVWYYHNLKGQPQKKKIVSRWEGYHGTTVASASLTGSQPSTGPSTSRSRTSSTPSRRITTGTRRRGSPRRTTPRRWLPSWRRSSSGKGPTPSPRSSPSRSWAPGGCWSRRGPTSRRSRPCSASTTS